MLWGVTAFEVLSTAMNLGVVGPPRVATAVIGLIVAFGVPVAVERIIPRHRRLIYGTVMVALSLATVGLLGLGLSAAAGVAAVTAVWALMPVRVAVARGRGPWQYGAGFAGIGMMATAVLGGALWTVVQAAVSGSAPLLVAAIGVAAGGIALLYLPDRSGVRNM
jgi:hypothetical protein